MIRSMTGFGRCRDTVDGRDVTVEIRSVNNRYLDCSVHISRRMAYLEDRVKPYLQQKGISRGKVDVRITAEDSGGEALKELDPERVRDYLRSLRRLRDEFGLKDDISVMTVAKNAELFTAKPPVEDPESDWAALLPVLGRATDALLAAREREGESLCRDIRSKLTGIRQTVDRIEALSAESLAQYRERLTERLRTVLAEYRLTPDDGRILTECAVYADKISVDEELVRLRAHLDAVEQVLAGDGAAGRRLDFLLQEIHREINTTGSKCSSAPVAGLVVDVKCELEKVREQIQNLE